MSIEALLWGVIPTAIALASTVVSVACVAKRRKKSQMFSTAVVAVFTVFSLWLLKKVFVDGAWPNYLPHILIVAALVIAVVQMRSLRLEKKNA
ncbi:MAG TPA: hypothetical protein VHC20_06670 [Candidatus Paceibacterota bacterium]|nr:hypothetical protein [Candidatus Paceibacterota bacterium]